MSEQLSAAEWEEKINGSPFNAFCNASVTGLDYESLTFSMTMPMRPEFERRAGTGQWHGGPIAAFIDTVGDYAMALHVNAPVPTINFRVDYLRPAMNTDLHGEAKVRRAGRTVGVVDIDICDNQGRLVAVGRGCYSSASG
ncbi:MAG: PaaI family thioesterase [Pseudomonadota bacterium]